MDVEGTKKQTRNGIQLGRERRGLGGGAADDRVDGSVEEMSRVNGEVQIVLLTWSGDRTGNRVGGSGGLRGSASALLGQLKLEPGPGQFRGHQVRLVLRAKKILSVLETLDHKGR
jgi:hypothetical protein